MNLYLGKQIVTKEDRGAVTSIGLQGKLSTSILGPEVTVWLHENEDSRAHLESDEGPLPYLGLREGWRIFLIEGTGNWRARYLNGTKGAWEVVYVRIRFSNYLWCLELSSNAWD